MLQEAADAFFLEVPKEKPAKCLSLGFRQGENWIKGCIFHRVAEVKQPHAMTDPFRTGSKTLVFSSALWFFWEEFQVWKRVECSLCTHWDKRITKMAGIIVSGSFCAQG